MSKADDLGANVEMSAKLFEDEKEPPAVVVVAAQSPKGLRKQVIDAGCIGLNIISTVTLVFLNKWYVCKGTKAAYPSYKDTIADINSTGSFATLN